MKPSLIIALLTFCFNAFAQNQNGLVLEYDLFNNQVTYLRDGQKINTPQLTQGENLYITIKEFNPYVMNAQVEVNKGNSQSSFNYNSFGNEGESQNFSGIANLFGGLSLGNNIQEVFQNIPGSRGASSVEIAQAKQKFNLMIESLSNIERDINSAQSQIKKIEKVESSRALALNDIHDLKTNSHIRPSRLKELIEEEIYHAFAKNKGDQIDIEDLIDDDKLRLSLEKAVANYNAGRAEYLDLSKDWDTFNNSLQLLELINEDLQFDFIKSTTDSIAQQLQSNVNSKFSSPLIANYNEQANISTKDLAQLRRTLEEIQSDIFIYKHPPVQANGENVNVSINIKLNENNEGYVDYKNLVQNIPVSGSWKITGGLGLAFGVLQDESYSYSTRNSIIVAEENDQFIPMITSFAHIYRQSPSAIKLGGSFGVGFPLSGGSGLSSASFFLGPTIVIGKNQKFLLTGGIMGSKVERLGAGLKVGDMLEVLSGEIPIKSNYELGYFIGISYDLIK